MQQREGTSRGTRWISTGLTSAVVTCMVTTATVAQYDRDKVTLLAELSPSQLGSSSGNDCWGYVSPSGREYAFMGLYHHVAIVEITDPRNPVHFASISHPGSSWSDIKTYRHYAYVGNETGGYIQVLDLGDIDNHNVAVVGTGGPPQTHNLAMDETSGYLYTCGSRNVSSGLIAMDVFTDPTAPLIVGSFRGNYIHDAEFVTHETGQYAGRQICYGAAAGDGVVIIDVTDKKNMFKTAERSYTGVDYAHQCWLSPNRQFLYLNDEGDELSGRASTTRTLIFDVSNINNPVYVTDFSTGLRATDHNLYMRDTFIFEANYRSGLHIFDAANPIAPRHIGFFDTYPANDNAGYQGAWSVYPFFPSGTVIVSDIQRGLFILDPSEALESSRMVIDVPPLVAGQDVTITASNAAPSEDVFFMFSISGDSATYVESIGAMLNLRAPRLGGTVTADGSGSAALTVPVVGSASGLNVWLQAAQDGVISNMVSTTVQ